VWRSYVTAARTSGVPLVEVRYEELATDPAAVARALSPALDASVEALTGALTRVHSSSVGRYRTDLSAEQLAEVEAEAGPLLRELGYA
jgi:LPS sulfotransferase NodH